MTVAETLARHFNKRVVIGLRRVAGFFNHIEPRSYFDPEQPHSVELFSGIDATECPPPPWWTELPGMWGCNESHKAVLSRALSDGIDRILIMEDDCRFVPGAAEQIDAFMAEVPADWDALMFGGQVSVHDGKTTPVSARVSRCVQVERLHCYALARKGMQTFYHALCEPGSCLPNDYRFGDLQERGELITYRIEPFVAYQADGPSAISGRVEPARVWDERVDVRIRKPEDVPIIALVCPFDVMDQLRQRGIISNGGETPPQFATLEPGRVQKGELSISNAMLNADDDTRQKYIQILRGDAAFHRNAVFALWHPSEFIPCPNATRIKADTYEDAAQQVQTLLRPPHPPC